MNELIHISQTNINGTDINSVDARELHTYLKVKTAFSNWIKRAIEKYDFIENEDYVTLITDAKSGKRDFIVSMDMAKELSMLENNDKGKETRKYFIEAEKTKQIALPSKIELAQMVIEAETKVLALENTVKIKDEIILAVADLNIKAGEVSIADFAKNLAIKGLGQNNLYVYLRGRGYLMLNNAPYSQYVERGYFVRKPTKEKHGGEIRYKTMITPKGTVWLTKIIKAEYEIDDA